MVDIGRHVFIVSNRMRGGSKVKGSSKTISHSYYKSLFGASDEGNVTLDETRIDDIPQAMAEENDILTTPFSEEEVRVAVFQMEHNKAPGPNGFPA